MIDTDKARGAFERHVSKDHWQGTYETLKQREKDFLAGWQAALESPEIVKAAISEMARIAEELEVEEDQP